MKNRQVRKLNKLIENSEVDSSGDIVRWGYCLDDCPAETPDPVCRSPPPVPAFGAHGTVATAFQSRG